MILFRVLDFYFWNVLILFSHDSEAKNQSVIENSFKIYPTLHGTRDINNMLLMSLMKLDH